MANLRRILTENQVEEHVTPEIDAREGEPPPPYTETPKPLNYHRNDTHAPYAEHHAFDNAGNDVRCDVIGNTGDGNSESGALIDGGSDGINAARHTRGPSHSQPYTADTVDDCGCVTRNKQCIAFVAVLIMLLSSFSYLYLICNYSHKATPPPARPVCTAAMYGNDTYAYWSCAGLDALQNNWFPSPIAGLFSYQTWNGYDGFWQNGLVLETMSNFIIYTNSKRYASILKSSLRSVYDLTMAYYPEPSCDDELWFGLSYARVYEALDDEQFLERSKEILAWAWETCWDNSGKCYGGLWFDNSRGYKATITNVEGFALAAKLYRLTKHKEYLTKALQLKKYLIDNDIINADFLLSDAIDRDTCVPNNATTLTYDSGMAIGGFLELFLGTGNSTFLNTAHNIALANIKHLSYNGILTESCDNSSSCLSSKDGRAFKGIFVRNLRYLINYSDLEHINIYMTFLRHNADSVLANATCYAQANVTSDCHLVFQDGDPFNTPVSPVFSENWHGPYNFSTPIEHTSALELLIASIDPDTECSGEHCNFDPHMPDIERLDCDPNPCPRGYTCCTWQPKYHTCCTPGQKCISGGCY